MLRNKVITVALGSLQRLVALPAASLSAIPAIMQKMNDCMSQGVDIQLKILQSLVTNFPTIRWHPQQTTRKRTCFRSVLPPSSSLP
jgi:hypothetical protein